MISWRITKYNPKHRNEKDEYQKMEWTSCGDIGKLYDGKEFTLNDYMAVENAYIYIILLFMKNVDITTLTVKYLEKYNDTINRDESPLAYTEEMIKLFDNLHEGNVLESGEIESLCRLSLRERLWCKLENDNIMFVHFGYDYYMYIGCSSNYENVISLTDKTGLFIEKFESPYLL